MRRPMVSSGFCNGSLGEQYFLNTAAGGGGPSGCAMGAPATAGIVGGTCSGYPKPAWQSFAGNPADGVRDIPDVSLFSGNGVYGHYYVFCWSDPAYSTEGSAPHCAARLMNWSGGGEDFIQRADYGFHSGAGGSNNYGAGRQSRVHILPSGK